MVKYFVFILLIISGYSFSMHSSVDSIDLEHIQTITKKVRRKENKCRITYCAHFSSTHQLMAEKITDGLKSDVCCDLMMINGASFHAIPLYDGFFELVEAKYKEMH